MRRDPQRITLSRRSMLRRLLIGLTALLTVASGLTAAAPIASAANAKSASQTAKPVPGPIPKQHPQPKNLPTLENGYGPTPQQKAAMSAASSQAGTTGKAVTVDGLTTETQQVQAQPNGRFLLTENTQPVRTQQHGTWIAVDTSLHRNTNGTYSPAATAYGTVTFSGGGSTPLASTTSGSTTYTVSWPGTLPTPTVSGSTATYPNVLPGVDLAVTATVDGGFSDVLIVHTAAAAHNPQLASLSLPTSVTGGHLQQQPHGTIAITNTSGGDTLTASTALAWDSNTVLGNPAGGAAHPNGTPAGPPVTADPSDTAHPGLAAHVGVIATHATASQLTLTPDQSLLTSSHTVFPVYLDPSFIWHPASVNSPDYDEVKQGQPCTNVSLFDNSGDAGDSGNLGVGYNKWNSCYGIQRAYYQWQIPSVLWGATIGYVPGQPGAVVDVTKTYSASCISSTDYLHWAGGIGSGTNWNNQPSYGPGIPVSSSTNPQGVIGPANNPKFCTSGGAPSGGFDVTSQIQATANSHGTQFTAVLTGNESSGTNEFSRFSDTPTLQIFYDLPPNTPGPEWAANGSDNVGCDTDTKPTLAHPYPYIGKTIETNEPVLNATVSDPDGDHLQATFTYRVNSSPIQTGLSADNLVSGTTAQFTLPASFVSTLKDQDIVSWQATVTDGQQPSPAGPTCYFRVEPQSPSAPTISSADGLYPSNGTAGAIYGTPGRFTLSATGGNVTTLVKGLDETPPLTSYPASDVAPMDGGSTIAPTGRWTLSDNTGTTAADSSGNNHPATLYGGASWTTDPTRGPVLALNGSTGYAATTGPAVDTQGSFTVSAWVNATGFANGAWQTFLSQQATTNSGFYLERDPATGDWAFTMAQTDTNPPPIARVESPTPAVANTWTHLAGTYDSATATMTFYVNGAAVGTATNTQPISTTGSLAIGHGFYNATADNYANGSISDVQAYQFPLSATDITEIYQGKTVGAAARWTFSEGKGTTAGDSSGNNHPATVTGGYTWNTGIPSALSFTGTNGSATTSGPVLNTQASFTVSAWVQVNAVTAGNWQTFLVQQAGTGGGFYLERDGGSGDWSFSRVETDTTNPAGDRAESSSPATTGVWTHLVGTFDAGSGTMTLYVNGTTAGTAIDHTPIASTGPVDIGHGFYNGVAGNYANASIADVQLYQSTLDASEVSQLYASATFSLTPPSPGPHTLYGYAADAAGDPSGYQAYRFIASPHPHTTCSSLAACYNNTGISPDTNPGAANFDGEGNSFSATDLTNAGWNSGGTLTVNGATFALPSYGSGQADNVLAANQIIPAKNDPTLSSYNTTVGSATGSSALEFLVSASNGQTVTPGAINGDDTAPSVAAGTAVAGSYCFDPTNPGAYCAPTGTVTYSSGNPQPFGLTVPDWVTGPGALAALTTPHENAPTGQYASDAKIYTFSIPLRPGATITSITLPDVSSSAAPGSAGLHIFSMATRNTTTGTGIANAPTWTGSWAAPTEGLFNYGSTFTNESFREAIKPSLAGGTVRIKLDNALNNLPASIGAATIALAQTSATPTPVAAGPPTALTFNGGAPSTVIPAGGMVYSDPLTFTVTANQSLLITFYLKNSLAFMPTHTDTSGIGYQWVSGANTGDNTTDATGTPFENNGPGGPSTNILTGLDVATAHVATQAVVGDGFIDQAQTGKRPVASANLADDLTATEATTPAPYGSIAEGIESNQIMTDYPEANGGGPALLSRIDRDVLDQPGVTTVILDEGLEDILTGRNASDLNANGYTELLNYLADAGIGIIVVGLSPCDGYAGDGASTNDACTAAVDSQRVTMNTDLQDNSLHLTPWTPVPLFYLDTDNAIGIPDTSNGETKLNPAADGGDHVNLTNAGFATLATLYLSAQDTWPLNDGANDTSASLATDAASNAANPYLANNPLTGNNPVTLSSTGTRTVTWPTDPTRGTVLGLDGSEYGHAPGAVLTTTGSYTVSAWANLSATTHDADIISQDGSQDSGFALQYDQADNQWAFTMPTSDTANATYVKALSGSAPTTGTWTHLTGTYNAVTQTLSLYVNGTLTGTATDKAPTNATGALTIGRGQANGDPSAYFPGELSTIQAWNYALTPTQITALYQQIN